MDNNYEKRRFRRTNTSTNISVNTSTSAVASR